MVACYGYDRSLRTSSIAGSTPQSTPVVGRYQTVRRPGVWTWWVVPFGLRSCTGLNSVPRHRSDPRVIARGADACPRKYRATLARKSPELTLRRIRIGVYFAHARAPSPHRCFQSTADARASAHRRIGGLSARGWTSRARRSDDACDHGARRSRSLRQ